MKPIHKIEVEGYVVGLIRDPKRRQEIEAARETDPQVQKWFRLFDTTPEINPIFVEQGRELAKEYFQMLDLVDQLAEEVRQTVPVPKAIPSSLLDKMNTQHRELNFVFALSGSPNTTKDVRSNWDNPDQKDYYFWFDATEIYLKVPVSEMESGLGLFEIIDTTGKKTWYPPRLELDDRENAWLFNEPIQQVLGYVPADSRLSLRFYPATELTRAMFQNGRIQEFVADLPPRCEDQKQRATEYLANE